jgi:hypothetical protein
VHPTAVPDPGLSGETRDQVVKRFGEKFGPRDGKTSPKTGGQGRTESEMMIGAGSLDRLVKLQSATVTNDMNSNEPVSTWTTYATVYAAQEFHAVQES